MASSVLRHPLRRLTEASILFDRTLHPAWLSSARVAIADACSIEKSRKANASVAITLANKRSAELAVGPANSSAKFSACRTSDSVMESWTALSP
jgi:hypothetical protein